jgi:FtsP/CotA-like multicopper oxidase with cupredoxin domain
MSLDSLERRISKKRPLLRDERSDALISVHFDPQVGVEVERMHLDGDSNSRHSQRNTCLWLSVMIAVIFSFSLFITYLQHMCSLKNSNIPGNTVGPKFSNSLQVVSREALISVTELDLKTHFGVSAEPTVRVFVFNIIQALSNPDGFQKPMILVDGGNGPQAPGPLIEANTGDIVRVTVHNMMQDASTSIHWHGIWQQNTSFMDGVVGVSQCAIPPGQKFTYEFNVTGQRGTYWYHSHLRTQYTDGLFGPIIIHDPKEMVPKYDDDKIVFVGDLYHTYSSTVSIPEPANIQPFTITSFTQILNSYLKPSSEWSPNLPGVEPLADNLIMNGQNTYNCSIKSSTFPPSGRDGSTTTTCDLGSLYLTRIQSGNRIRLRIINHSSYFSYWISIDSHPLEIIEIDGVEVEPISANGLYVNIGQRYSVLIKADQTKGNYYIRAQLVQSCFLPYANYQSSGLDSASYGVRGILSYDDTDPSSEPIGVPWRGTNPYGSENNPLHGEAMEGCDDMPFDLPKPMRQQAAYDVADENKRYFEFEFRQAQDVNRIFINKVRSFLRVY